VEMSRIWANVAGEADCRSGRVGSGPDPGLDLGTKVGFGLGVVGAHERGHNSGLDLGRRSGRPKLEEPKGEDRGRARPR
jgi:hypothetical protein